MSRARARRRLVTLAWAAGCALTTMGAPAVGAAGKTVAPVRVALAVRWGAGAGSDAFRDELARSAAATLATRCFAAVVIADAEPWPEDTDLVLRVDLSDVVDETRFEDSIAGALQPGEPTKELRRVAHFEMTVDATLSTRLTERSVARKHFAVSAYRRPVYIGEDPQDYVRVQAITDVVDDLRRGLGCGGTKLDRKIREALKE